MTAAPKRINVALQGGGAHGAFTWGALERLIGDPRIEIAGISGTSAGALNGAAVKAGFVAGGRDAALGNLAWFWAQIGAMDDMRLPGWMAPAGVGAIARAIERSLPYQLADTASRLTSPYATGPFYQNPLARIVERFDYDRVCHDTGPAFFVSATRVRDGRLRVFRGTDITPEVLMASACLPTLFRALEFHDPQSGRVEAFWDGGYTGNPALFPLFDASLPDDIVIVNINPLERQDVPQSPQDIQNRINEISFNASLMKELRAINFVQRLLRDGTVPEGSMAKVNVHMISDDSLMTSLNVATKLIPNPVVLGELRAAGFAAADRFLDAHFGDLNMRSSVELEAIY